MLAAEKRRGEVLKQVVDCNCSIRTIHGYLHWSVPSEKLRLKTPEPRHLHLQERHVKHHFCPPCGCALFVSSPDGAYVNACCIERVEPSALKIEPFDGCSL